VCAGEVERPSRVCRWACGEWMAPLSIGPRHSLRVCGLLGDSGSGQGWRTKLAAFPPLPQQVSWNALLKAVRALENDAVLNTELPVTLDPLTRKSIRALTTVTADSDSRRRAREAVLRGMFAVRAPLTTAASTIHTCRAAAPSHAPVSVLHAHAPPTRARSPGRDPM
jgi:hypothetical protein